MLYAPRTLSLLVLALGVGLAGCDQPVDDGASDQGFRALGGIGTGSKLTLNTNQWVSSSARDVYEFRRGGHWHTNSYGYETKLQHISLPASPYGPVDSDVSAAPPPGQPKAKIAPGGDFTIDIHGPNPGDPVEHLEGPDLMGLELTFSVKGYDDNAHPVVLRFVDHLADEQAGDFYEIVKLDPDTGEDLAPLCEEDASGFRLARIFDGLSVDGESGEMDFVGQAVHHIGCTASAPAKALLFGYDPAVLTVESYIVANRVVRADYCADGHPYTYPGSLVGIDDNILPGKEDNTLADVQASLAADETVEAVWDRHGILCIDTPRASNVERPDIVCPIKQFANGSVEYNWRPPSCQDFVDPNPNAMRFFSKAEL